MKSYEEMVQWVVDNSTTGSMRLRYNEWPAIMAMSEIYDIAYETIANDIKIEKEIREKALKERRKAESRASNEQRRLANLAKQKGV